MIRKLLLFPLLMWVLPYFAKAIELPVNYLNPISYEFVRSIPDFADRKVLLVSLRNIIPEDKNDIRRGLHPRLKMSYFIVGTKNDSVYIQSCQNMTEALSVLDYSLDILLYVDGHGKTFGQNVLRGIELSDLYNINLIVFDWPTDYLALRKTADNASEAAVNFVKVTNDIYGYLRLQEEYSHNAVSVIFHSMGNLILKNIVRQNLLVDMPVHFFDNLILNAAAVNQRNHHKWVEELQIQKRIYITINNEDRPLRGAMLLRMSPQLGLGFKKSPAKNVIYLNFNNIASSGHNFFLGRSIVEKNNPQVSLFYHAAFHGHEVSFREIKGFEMVSDQLVSVIAY